MSRETFGLGCRKFAPSLESTNHQANEPQVRDGGDSPRHPNKLYLVTSNVSKLVVSETSVTTTWPPAPNHARVPPVIGRTNGFRL